MTADKRDEICREVFVEILDIMRKKSHDYASDADILSNFKQSALIQNTTPFKVVLGHSTNKVIRMNNLQSRDEVLNESTKDTLMDSIGYNLLGICLLMESEENSKGVVSKTLNKIIGK